jgi:8-oxo-dGTP pyrophosphatase MutT (NUDIX family)
MQITDDYIQKTLETFAKTLPRFPDGRIDYSQSKKAPVITVFIFFKDDLLLLKRSVHVKTYKGKWNSVAGYLDEIKPVKEKMLEEVYEETGIAPDTIESYHLGEPYTFTDDTNGYTWIVHSAKVLLKQKPTITLDWEHTEYTWIKPEYLKNYDTVPQLKKSLHQIIDLI